MEWFCWFSNYWAIREIFKDSLETDNAYCEIYAMWDRYTAQIRYKQAHLHSKNPQIQQFTFQSFQISSLNQFSFPQSPSSPSPTPQQKGKQPGIQIIIVFHCMIAEEVDVDRIISKLLQNGGKDAKLLQSQIRGLCLKSREIFLEQPMLLQLEAPIKICGDIHGQYPDLIKLFEYAGFPGETNYLFLGDYIDRGKQSIETICLMLAYKIKNPENFFMLRGNHECSSINRIYGFYDECKRKYNIKLWKTFSDVFNVMPVCAIIDEKIMCMHGGISPQLENFEQILKLVRPLEVPDQGLLCDLLWADPEKGMSGWAENERGVSFIFGGDVVSNFLKDHDIDLICRAHQVVEEGYEFFAKRQLVTIFSAPNYCGEFENSGAVMSVDESLMCSFQILKSSKKKK